MSDKIRDILNHPLLPILSRQAVYHAIRGEQTKAHGKALGLTEDEIREVVDAWVDWYRQTPWPFSWDRVSQMLDARAAGKKWTP